LDRVISPRVDEYHIGLEVRHDGTRPDLDLVDTVPFKGFDVLVGSGQLLIISLSRDG
jgi:hypothetical protein